MTKMTANSLTTTNELGQEQWETFNRKIGRKNKLYMHYEYRHIDGELYSIIKYMDRNTNATLEYCRTLRDEWIENKLPA